MRKFLLSCLVIAGVYVCFGAGDKEYAPAPVPNALYFVTHTNCPQGATSLTITNNETYMWCPYSIRFALRPDAGQVNTFEMIKLTRIERPLHVETRVFTNDFGNVETNYIHGITNDSNYLWITNTLISSVTTNTTNHVYYLDKEYIQKGDILQFIWTDSTNKWLTINAWR